MSFEELEENKITKHEIKQQKSTVQICRVLKQNTSTEKYLKWD